MSWSYWLTCLLWATGGFVGGIAICHRRSKVKKEALVDDGDSDDGRSRWRRHVNGQTAIGLLMLLIVGISVALLGMQATENKRQAAELHQQAINLADVSACQREYNEAFKQGLRIRSEAGAQDRAAATQDRNALRDLVSTILASPSGSQNARTALADFLKMSETADRQRADAEGRRQEAPLPTRDCDPDNTKSRPGR